MVAIKKFIQKFQGDAAKVNPPIIFLHGEVEGMQITPRIIMASFCSMVFNIKWASDREMDDFTNTMASIFSAGMVCEPKNVLPEEGGGGYSPIFSN